MVSKRDFAKDLGDAYEHLYDLVYLRTHPLIDLLLPTGDSRKEKAWQLHNLLLDVIQELNPGIKAPVFSREWRRHRLMTMRYLDGQTPQAVADQLSISRRHFYRELEGIMEVIADLLGERLLVKTPPQPVPEAMHRLELMRLEAARFAQSERSVPIVSIVRGAVELLAEKLLMAHISVQDQLELPSPEMEGGPQPLRQLILAVLGHILTDAQHTSLTLTLHPQANAARIGLRLANVQRSLTADEIETRQAALNELALLSAANLTLEIERPHIVGYSIDVPIAASQKTILIVDDNDDILELLERYLSAHDYRVLLARDAQQAIIHVQHSRPFAIVLDLMMPQMDGWDLLQRFLTQPNTQTVPIIICSVLKQKDLALSLGATAFIEKPISERLLLNILDSFL